MHTTATNIIADKTIVYVLKTQEMHTRVVPWYSMRDSGPIARLSSLYGHCISLVVSIFFYHNNNMVCLSVNGKRSLIGATITGVTCTLLSYNIVSLVISEMCCGSRV